MFNINNENVQLRLNKYLENEEWVKALDSFDLEKVFKLSSVIDYIWLCHLLEEENLQIPHIYNRFKDIKIQHVDKKSFKTYQDVSSREDGPMFEYEVNLKSTAETLKLLHLVYFTDLLDDYIYCCDLDLETDIEIQNINQAWFAVDSYTIDTDRFNDLNAYSNIKLHCLIKNYMTTIIIPDNKSFYKHKGSYYTVDREALIDAINNFIDELNRW